MRVFMSSGEVSGDAAGAALAHTLAERDPGGSLFGIGGRRMAAAGVVIDCPTNHLGTVGVSEALGTLPPLWRVFSAVRDQVRRTRPDVAVLIGNDVFSVILARWLRAHGVPTASFFPPQVWIWGALAGVTARSFDLILTCFDQEQEIYSAAGARHGTRVSFVGHYLAQDLAPRSPESMAAARRSLAVDNHGPVIGLLPGSRTHEIKTLCPVLLDAAARLLAERRDLIFIVPVADPGLDELIRTDIERHGMGEKVIVVGGSRKVMEAADLVLLASGTASLEAALIGVPMVITYRVSAVTNGIVQSAIRLGLMADDTVGLPNLILGRHAVPELKQRQANAEAVARAARGVLDDPARACVMRDSLAEVARRVRTTGSLELAADAVVELANGGGRTR